MTIKNMLYLFKKYNLSKKVKIMYSGGELDGIGDIKAIFYSKKHNVIIFDINEGNSEYSDVISQNKQFEDLILLE